MAKRFRGSAARFAYRRLVPASQRAAPGYTRTGGFFGRFNLGGAYSRLRRNPYVRRRDVEMKFHDVNTVDASVTTTAEASTSLNLIAQGTTQSQRIGRKCILKSVQCRGQVALAAQDDVAVPAGPLKFRIMLIWDKQANGAVPATSQILTDNTNINSFNNLANKGRFVTLYEYTDTLVQQAGSGTGVTGDWAGDIKQFQLYKKVNIPIEFDSTAGAITEIRSNNLFWVIYRQSAAVDNVTFTANVRLRFSDL